MLAKSFSDNLNLMFEIFYNFFGLNQKIFFAINSVINNLNLAYFLEKISWFFSISLFTIYYLLFLIYSYIRLKKIKNTKEREDNFWVIYNNMVNIGIIYAIFGFTYALLKFSINLPRPFCSLPIGSFITIINIENERCLSSFPSAHTGLAVLITYFLWNYLNSLGKIIALAIILLVAISRITLAMHYPADILYSFFIAMFVIKIGNFIYLILYPNITIMVGKILYKRII